MQSLGALLQPVLRHGSRVLGEYGRGMHVALFQTHTITVLDVDRGDDLHGSRVTAGATRRFREASRNCSGSGASVPGYEVGKQLKPGAVTLLRMELHGEDISLRYCASKRRRIVGAAGTKLGVGGRRIVAVREIKARRVGDALPERVRADLTHRAPAHVRHLEAVSRCRSHVFVAKATDAARHDAERASGPFLAVVEQ